MPHRQLSTYVVPVGNGNHNDEDDADTEPEERDPTGRFERYAQSVGRGRFKCVFKAFDTTQGIDIAWSKVLQGPNNLDDAQMKQIAKEMSAGLKLDHNNIIKCYMCWRDPEAHCINLITEFCTSGNLRDYRQKHHKQIELKAVKKWARQVLLGLNYLHSKNPPIIHGDLRCDKIYINGHSGEIAIGDLGLKTLLPTRFPPTVLPPPDTDTEGHELPNQYTRQVDVFAFGLVVLELVTSRRMDRSNSRTWPSQLDAVKDEEAKVFIAKCLGPEELRPSVPQLLEDRFLRKVTMRPGSICGDDHLGSTSAYPNGMGSLTPSEFENDLRRSSLGGTRSPPGEARRGTADGVFSGVGTSQDATGSSGGTGGASTSTSIPDQDDSMSAHCHAGQVQGEDYTFTFSGKLNDGKLNVELQMQYDGSDDDDDDEMDTEPAAVRRSRTIDFEYNPDVDTADEVASEMGNEFDLSSTDRDICAAALKEWLGRESDN